MKQYTFVLNFGYAESSDVAFLPFTSNKKFKDAKTALLDLCSFFKEHFMGPPREFNKSCCKTSLAKDGEVQFCSKCGKSFKQPEFDPKQFSCWISDLSTCNIDSLTQQIEYNYEATWDTNGIEGAPNLRFVYQAEWVILAALGYPHREEINFETICARRTKKKQDSFSYYN